MPHRVRAHVRRPLAAALLAAALAACSDAPPPARAPADAAAVAEVVYVDVRTAEEFAAGHLRGALHVPHDEMVARVRELEPYRDRRIILYCRSGRRSGLALDVLRQAGFTNAENGGGFDGLVARGVPVAD